MVMKVWARRFICMSCMRVPTQALPACMCGSGGSDTVHVGALIALKTYLCEDIIS